MKSILDLRFWGSGAFGGFPIYRQFDQMDCGSACLRMITEFFGQKYSASYLRKITQTTRSGVSLLGIGVAAETIGLQYVGAKLSVKALIKHARVPCILHWSQNHFVVLYRISERQKSFFRTNASGEYKSNTVDLDSYRFYIADPATGLIILKGKDFARQWVSAENNETGSGTAMFFEPTDLFFSHVDDGATFSPLSVLLKHVRNSVLLIFLILIGLLLALTISAILPVLNQLVVDVGIQREDFSFLSLLFLFQALLLLSSIGIDFARHWILLNLNEKLSLENLVGFIQKLLNLPISFYEAKQYADISLRIEDHDRVEGFITNHALTVVFSIGSLIIYGVCLAYLHADLFVITAICGALYAWWTIIFLRPRRVLDALRFEVSARTQNQTIHLIHGIQDIKLAGAQTLFLDQWKQTLERLARWNIKSLSLQQKQEAGFIALTQGRNLSIGYLTALAVTNHQMSIGEMMSVQFLLASISGPIEKLLRLVQGWQEARISLERIDEINSEDDEEAKSQILPRNNRRTDIVFSDVSFQYPGVGNENVLNNISLVIPTGKMTAIVGASGSGKTTLLKLLLKFYDPTSGEITFMDKDGNTDVNLSDISHTAWRKTCGVVMQDGYIFSDSIAYNIAIGNMASLDINLLEQAIQIANLSDFIKKLPQGYYTKIGKDGYGLSQGQCQRILIARAVYKQPDLLLFDEATNSLDAKNERIILANLANHFKERTMIVVAHRLSTVMDADQIVLLDNGTIAEVGTHISLLKNQRHYHELVNSQLQLA